MPSRESSLHSWVRQLDVQSSWLVANAFISGAILLNGCKAKLSFVTAAYVTQVDNLIGTLTVRETISYPARVRLPDNMPWEDNRALVESTIMVMGFQDCEDTVIANWHMRGISGREKRRVSIALRSSRGLGCSSSMNPPADSTVLHSGRIPLPHLAEPLGSLPQMRKLRFDKVKATLKGSMKLRFESTGDPLDRITTAEAIRNLVDVYRTSQFSYAARLKVEEMSKFKGTELDSGGSQASFFMQALTLTERSFVNMSRDFGYYWIRLIIYIMVTVCIGTIYLDVGNKYSSILARGACASFVFGFVTFMSIGGFPSFVEDMNVTVVSFKNLPILSSLFADRNVSLFFSGFSEGETERTLRGQHVRDQ